MAAASAGDGAGRNLEGVDPDVAAQYRKRCAKNMKKISEVCKDNVSLQQHVLTSIEEWQKTMDAARRAGVAVESLSKAKRRRTQSSVHAAAEGFITDGTKKIGRGRLDFKHWAYVWLKELLTYMGMDVDSVEAVAEKCLVQIIEFVTDLSNEQKLGTEKKLKSTVFEQ
eukprot:606554-Amphidinium_carterae.1